MESVGSTFSSTSRMDDFFATHNDASASISDSSISASAAPPPPRSKVVATRNKQANFSAYEDNVLCKSWLEISCDAATNTGQRKEAFWARVLNRYSSKCANYPERTIKSIMNRWDHIKAEVGKFSGHLAEQLRTNASGTTDADKSTAAATDFASIEKHKFTLMNYWQVLKDEPKWIELKRRMDNPQNNASREGTPNDSNTRDLHPVDSTPASSSGKCPMGRDAAKAAKKKAVAASSENVSKMHDLSVQKIELFKETEAQRKARLDEMVALEKVKAEEAREHQKMMLDIERERLAMDKQRFQMDAENKRNEEEKKEKEEDERIMAINLDECLPMQRMYYEALQQDILQRTASRRHGQLM